ncbi:MAG: glycoside hydrolase family 5 protein [Clostridia bacterium]|nr:glycoside hydrolase family 5 protein [Clostridia bacterium]
MKVMLSLVLAAALLLGLAACIAPKKPSHGEKALPADSTPEGEGTTAAPETAPSPEVKECESAESFAQNMTVGWNLGLALSYFAEQPKAGVEGLSGLVFFMASDGSYSRSDNVAFDLASKTAEITWTLGENGILTAGAGSSVTGIGVEQWNFSLGAADKLTYRLEALSYVTADGAEVSCDAARLTEYTTDMSDGTGGQAGLMAADGGLAVSEIKEIRAKMKFVGIDRAREVTPESIDYAQTRWGNPLTTQEMINAVRDKGFNLIRVQVSYVTHMDHAGNIDKLWLDRVAEVVDYCMNAGVYCLLTSTGAGWLEAERETFPEHSAVYRRMWEQISARFADYGELLLFEACNEVLNADKLWSNPPKESYDVMNELYQIFVDTVRAGGGYNTTRNLVLNPYAAAYEYNMNQNFKLPQDSTDGHLIAEVHCYEPNNFCFNEINLGSNNFTNEWGTKAERAKIEIIMKNLKRRFVEELGVPVIVGEFGVVDRADEDTRAQYVGHFAKMAEKYGVKLVIFDDGGDFTVFERTDLSWPYEKVIEALLTRGASVE